RATPPGVAQRARWVMTGLHRSAAARGRSHRRALRARQPAQAVVETAMLFLFLCGLFLVVLDFGQVLHRYLVVAHATSAAARVAAVENSTLADIQTAAQNAAADSLPSAQVTLTCKATSFTLSGGTPTGAY